MASADSAKSRRIVACIAFTVAARDVDRALSNPPSVVCALAVPAAICRQLKNAVTRAIPLLFVVNRGEQQQTPSQPSAHVALRSARMLHRATSARANNTR